MSSIRHHILPAYCTRFGRKLQAYFENLGHRRIILVQRLIICRAVRPHKANAILPRRLLGLRQTARAGFLKEGAVEYKLRSCENRTSLSEGGVSEADGRRHAASRSIRASRRSITFTQSISRSSRLSVVSFSVSVTGGAALSVSRLSNPVSALKSFCPSTWALAAKRMSIRPSA